MRKDKFTARFLVLVACLLLFSGCGGRQEKVADFLARGDRLLAAGDPVRAVLEYKCALQIDVKNVKASLGLGRCYLAEKDFQRASGAFNAALELDPGCVEARVEAARLLVMSGYGQEALDSLKKLKDPGKYERTAVLTRARALAGLKQYKEAIAILSGLKGVGGVKEGQMLLAYCFRATGRDPAMKEAVSRWRGLDRKDPSSYLFLAQYWTQKKDGRKAIAELDAMAAADPKNEKLGLLRARSLEDLGFIKEAGESFDSLKGGNDILSERADFWLRRNDLTKGASLLEKVIAADPKNVDAVIKLARIYSGQGQSPKARNILHETLKGDLNPAARAEILLARAALEAHERNFDQAEKLCKAVLAENQNDIEAQLLLGKILLSVGKPFEAEIHLSQAAASRPNDDQVQILLARSQLENKNDSSALDTLRNALQANPGSLSLRSELLRCCLRKNEVGQALQLLDGGIALHPEEILLIKARGEIEASQKNWDEAGKNFEKIIALQPENPLGYLEMGRLELSRAKSEEAARWFKKAAGFENGWQVAIPALFQVYMSRGDAASAQNAVKTEVQKHQDSPVACFILGQALEKTGDLAGAENTYTKASGLAPQWPDPYWAIAGIYLQSGRLPAATATAEAACKASPSAALRTELAVFYQRAGRFDDAIDAYNELIKESGERPELLNNLAYLYAENTTDKNKLAGAARLIKDALVQRPGDPQFLDTAAWVAYKRGDLENARVYATEAMSGSPRAVYSLHAAMILNAQGKKDQALKYLNEAIENKSDGLDKQSLELANQLKKEWSGT